MLNFQGQDGRRERQKRERRARIEAAARAVFAERGYEAATTREIAERADVSIGTLFAYAPEKRSLLALVFRDGLHALTETTFAALPEGPLLERLLAVFAPRYAFWGADPALARHAVRETIALSYDGTTPPEAVVAQHLRPLVHQAQERGEVDPAVDADLLVRVVLDLYLSENRAWLAGAAPDVEAGVAALRAALELVLRGVLRRSESGR